MNPLLRCAAAREDIAKRDSNICVLKKGYVGQKSANDAEIDLISKWFIPLKLNQSPSSQVTIQTSLNNVPKPHWLNYPSSLSNP